MPEECSVHTVYWTISHTTAAKQRIHCMRNIQRGNKKTKTFTSQDKYDTVLQCGWSGGGRRGPEAWQCTGCDIQTTHCQFRKNRAGRRGGGGSPLMFSLPLRYHSGGWLWVCAASVKRNLERIDSKQHTHRRESGQGLSRQIVLRDEGKTVNHKRATRKTTGQQN